MAILSFYKNAVKKNIVSLSKYLLVSYLIFSFPMLIEVPILNFLRPKRRKNLHFCMQNERFSQRRQINTRKESFQEKVFIYLFIFSRVILDKLSQV